MLPIATPKKIAVQHEHLRSAQFTTGAPKMDLNLVQASCLRCGESHDDSTETIISLCGRLAQSIMKFSTFVT
jgi:hypothetical protein